MWEGYLALGGNEVINNARAVGYTDTASCQINWLVCPPCDGVRDAVGDGPYVIDTITSAPWYDVQDEPTHRFYGVSAILIEGLQDSTRTANVTEGIKDGGTVGQVRHAAKRLRVRAMLSAQGQDALAAGFAWLDAVLRPNACGAHGDACGTADADFFVTCPPEQGETDPAVYALTVAQLGRHLHNVTCVSGPIIEQTLHRGEAWGYIVEFVLVAATPWIFSATRPITLTETLPVVVQDVVYNLVPYPSAELVEGTVVVATNYSTNPSVENTSGFWTAGSAVVNPANVTGSQVAEHPAEGTNSWQVHFAATSGGTVGQVRGEHSVTTPLPILAGRRFSVRVSGFLESSGTVDVDRVEVTAIWRTSTTVNRTDVLGTLPAGGGAVIGRSIAPPATSNNVIIRATVYLDSWATGAVVDLFLDAAAVTSP